MSNLHAKEYEIYEGKSLVAQTYGGPLYQHCNDKSYGEAVMLAKKMAACEDVYEALEEAERVLRDVAKTSGLTHSNAESVADDAKQALKKARGEV